LSTMMLNNLSLVEKDRVFGAGKSGPMRSNQRSL
jgi:hypothetical protein